MSAMNKANQRQHGKRKGYYAAQFDRTVINKLITMARHIVRFGDKRAMDRLKQRPAMDKHRAMQKTESPRIKQVLREAS